MSQAGPQPDLEAEYGVLTSQLAGDPRDPDSWHRLIHISENSENLEKIMTTYDAFLLQYPNNPLAQVHYLDHLIKHDLKEKAEDLFMRYLPTSPSVELWKRYINYVRCIAAPSQRHIIKQSYEYTLKYIGQDSDSGSIWGDYIHFLENEALKSDSEEMSGTLRETYRRAVQIPLCNLDQLWKDFERLELLSGDGSGKDTVIRLTPVYLQNRTVLHQLKSLTAQLSAPRKSGIYLPQLPSFDASERSLVGRWKIYLKWEESNPLGFDEKDKSVLAERIRLAYRKALIEMTYHTEIWFMAYDWSRSNGLEEEAISFLTSGLKVNPSSHVLTFTMAEALEIKSQHREVHAVYTRLLINLSTQLEKLENASNALTLSATSGPVTSGVFLRSVVEQTCGTAVSRHSLRLTKSQQATELKEKQVEYGLVWVMYMRFGMRAEGLQALRSVFAKARKDRWITWEIYDASAMMEYHFTGEKEIASRIYEKGMNVFGKETGYILRYLEFLTSVNDRKNAHALFERAVYHLPSQQSQPLWEFWSRYQYMYGDLDDTLKLEKRIEKEYPSVSSIKRLAQRHVYLGVDPIAEHDLGFAIFKREAIAPSTADHIVRRPSSDMTPHSIDSKAVAEIIASKNRPLTSDEEYKPQNTRDAYHNGLSSTPRKTMGSGRGRENSRHLSRFRFSPLRVSGSLPYTGFLDSRMSPSRRWRDEDKREITLPQEVSLFMSQLPRRAAFDGPVFCAEDLMRLICMKELRKSSGK